MPILGITERAIKSSYFKPETNERSIHLHLYNQFESDRNCIYARSYTVWSEKKLLIKRVIIKDERNLTTIGFDTYSDEHNITFKRKFSENAERHIVTNFYFIEHSERFCCDKKEPKTYENDRTILLVKCYATDYRICFTKSWHVSTRYCKLTGQPKQIFSSERNCILNLHSNVFHSDRNCFSVFYHSKFNLTINCFYNNWNIICNTPYEKLFENEHVVEEQLNFTQLSITDDLMEDDIILVKKINNEWITENLSTYACLDLNVEPISSNTYSFKGYLIFLRSFISIKFSYRFNDIGAYNDEYEYWHDYIRLHGYINTIFNGITIRPFKQYNYALEPYDLIAFEYIILDEEIEKGNNILNIKWYDITVNKLINECDIYFFID